MEGAKESTSKDTTVEPLSPVVTSLVDLAPQCLAQSPDGTEVLKVETGARPKERKQTVAAKSDSNRISKQSPMEPSPSTEALGKAPIMIQRLL